MNEAPEQVRRSLVRGIWYDRCSHALHAKFYRRLSLWLSALALLGLSAPLTKLMGGDNSGLALWAAVFFVIIQAIDWKVASGEKAGLHSAKAREFHRLLVASDDIETDDLRKRRGQVGDNELDDIESVRQIAFVAAATEQGYESEVPIEHMSLTRWQRAVRILFLF